jgi:hypothetical protein
LMSYESCYDYDTWTTNNCLGYDEMDQYMSNPYSFVYESCAYDSDYNYLPQKYMDCCLEYFVFECGFKYRLFDFILIS